jgi:hypothetical protein
MAFPAGPVRRSVNSTILRVNVRSSTLSLAEATSHFDIAIVVDVNIRSMAKELDGNGQMMVSSEHRLNNR